MCDNMAIFTDIMKIAENDPFLRLQMKPKMRQIGGVFFQ